MLNLKIHNLQKIRKELNLIKGNNNNNYQRPIQKIEKIYDEIIELKIQKLLYNNSQAMYIDNISLSLSIPPKKIEEIIEKTLF